MISDRFTDSTYAYQGAGRGLERETIRRIDSAVLDDFAPDLTLILDLDVDSRSHPAHARAGAENRFEKFDRDFHERLRQAFLDIARRNPDRCGVIDASGTEDQVADADFGGRARRVSIYKGAWPDTPRNPSQMTATASRDLPIRARHLRCSGRTRRWLARLARIRVQAARPAPG